MRAAARDDGPDLPATETEVQARVRRFIEALIRSDRDRAVRIADGGARSATGFA
jgi:hypothetical protein